MRLRSEKRLDSPPLASSSGEEDGIILAKEGRQLFFQARGEYPACPKIKRKPRPCQTPWVHRVAGRGNQVGVVRQPEVSCFAQRLMTDARPP